MDSAFCPLISKLPQVGTTIFTVMSALAREHQALNLSQGFPDFDADPLLLGFCTEAMQQGMNQYAPMSGLPSLQQQIALQVATRYGAVYDPTHEITLTCGATEAIFCAIMALVHPGEEVIVIEPAYDCYVPAILMSGGTPVCIPLRAPDYQIDWQEVADHLSAKTRLLILNSPHNPTGRMLRATDLEALSQLSRGHGFGIVSDEVYEYIHFDGKDHLSLSRYPELRDRTLVISSFGKSLHVTGWKVGYCLAPEALTREFRKVHQFVTFSSSTPFQAAISQYLQRVPERVEAVGAFYQQKRDQFLQLLSESRFRPLPCEGTYFQLMDYSEISDMPDTEFAQWLTVQHGVACIPVSVFYTQPPEARVVRFCFAKQSATLIAAAERLIKVGSEE